MDFIKINRYKIAFNRLIKQLDPVSKYYNKWKVFLLLDFAYCFIRYGSSPRDYINFEFYKLKNCERNKFLTMKRTHKVEKIYNDNRYAEIFNNKYNFNKRFSDYIRREWIYGPNVSLQEFITFLKVKRKVMIKPLGLSSGKGIYSINID